MANDAAATVVGEGGIKVGTREGVGGNVMKQEGGWAGGRIIIGKLGWMTPGGARWKMEGVGSLAQTATAAKAGVPVERCSEIGLGNGGGSSVFFDDCIISVAGANLDDTREASIA